MPFAATRVACFMPRSTVVMPRATPRPTHRATPRPTLGIAPSTKPWAALLVALLVTGLAGCIDDTTAPTIDDAADIRIETSPRSGAAAAGDAGTRGARDDAATATAANGPRIPTLDATTVLRFDGTCDGACSIRFDNQFVGGAGAWIEARIAWDGAVTPSMNLTFEGASGEAAGKRGFDAARALLWSPQTGEHTLRVAGSGAFTGWVQAFRAGAWRGDGETLLPNLVTLVPEEIGIAACHADEQAEQGAQRCLRLGNAIGNIGDGPLQVVLSIPDGALAVAGQGNFLQRIFMADGSWHDEVVMGAEFHLMHSHFHYRGVAEFTLYEYDGQTGLRGDAVSATKKSGFCLLDIGQMRGPDVPEETDGRYAEQDCLVPLSADGWTMGVSRGWYDYYTAGLADQYVDVAGVPDGVYELVSVADAPASLAESDETDNAASVIVRLTGDDVEVLQRRGFYRV
jgi:hypothetical protein